LQAQLHVHTLRDRLAVILLRRVDRAVRAVLDDGGARNGQCVAMDFFRNADGGLQAAA
jgi:hypothetical protein